MSSRLANRRVENNSAILFYFVSARRSLTAAQSRRMKGCAARPPRPPRPPRPRPMRRSAPRLRQHDEPSTCAPQSAPRLRKKTQLTACKPQRGPKAAMGYFRAILLKVWFDSSTATSPHARARARAHARGRQELRISAPGLQIGCSRDCRSIRVPLAPNPRATTTVVSNVKSSAQARA